MFTPMRGWVSVSLLGATLACGLGSGAAQAAASVDFSAAPSPDSMGTASLADTRTAVATGLAEVLAAYADAGMASVGSNSVLPVGFSSRRMSVRTMDDVSNGTCLSGTAQLQASAPQAAAGVTAEIRFAQCAVFRYPNPIIQGAVQVKVTRFASETDFSFSSVLDGATIGLGGAAVAMVGTLSCDLAGSAQDCYYSLRGRGWDVRDFVASEGELTATYATSRADGVIVVDYQNFKPGVQGSAVIKAADGQRYEVSVGNGNGSYRVQVIHPDHTSSYACSVTHVVACDQTVDPR